MTPEQQAELKAKLAAAGLELLGVDGEKVIIGDTIRFVDQEDIKRQCSDALKSIQHPAGGVFDNEVITPNGAVTFLSKKESKRRRHGKRPKFHGSE